MKRECVLLPCRHVVGDGAASAHSGDSRRTCVSGHSYVHFGPGLLEARQLKKEQKLVAVAYAKKRVNPMRPADAAYGPQKEIGGTMGSNDETDDLKYPELNKAWSILTDKLNSGGTLGPKWFQIKGELLLIKNPAKNAKAAEDSFLQARAHGLDEPSLDIDLATSYFEQLSENSKNPG